MTWTLPARRPQDSPNCGKVEGALGGTFEAALVLRGATGKPLSTNRYLLLVADQEKGHCTAAGDSIPLGYQIRRALGRQHGYRPSEGGPSPEPRCGQAGRIAAYLNTAKGGWKALAGEGGTAAQVVAAEHGELGESALPSGPPGGSPLTAPPGRYPNFPIFSSRKHIRGALQGRRSNV